MQDKKLGSRIGISKAGHKGRGGGVGGAHYNGLKCSIYYRGVCTCVVKLVI